MLLTIAFGALVGFLAFGFSRAFSPFRATVAAATGAVLFAVAAYFNVYPTSYREDVGIVAFALLLSGLGAGFSRYRRAAAPRKAGVGAVLLAALFLTSLVPLTAWGASTIDEPIYNGLQSRATAGPAPPLSNATDVRAITWAHAADLFGRGFGEDASFLATSRADVMRTTYPDFVNGTFLWLHPTAPQTAKWLLGGIYAERVLFVRNSASNDVPEALPGRLAVQLDAAWWHERVAAHARDSGELRWRLTDVAMQLDDSWHPYWIGYLAEVDWRGQPHLVRLLIVDAYTGEERLVTPQEAPSWLEQVYPESYVYSWASYWGLQREGLLYRLFNAARLVEPDDVTVRYIRLGDATYWLLPMVQLGSHQLGGYILVNARTGEATFYDRFDRALVDYSTALAQLEAIMASGRATEGGGAIQLSVSEGYLYPVRMADGSQRDAYVFPLRESLRIARFAIIDARDFNTYRVFKSSISDALAEFAALTTGGNASAPAGQLVNLTGGVVDAGRAIVNLNGTLYRVTTTDLAAGERREADREMDELTYAIAEVNRGVAVALEVRIEGGRIVDVRYPGVTWGS